MSRLFVGGIQRKTSYRDLEREFQKFGRIISFVPKSDYCFVEYEDRRDAEDALYRLNRKDVCGSRINVEFARSRATNYRPRDRDERPYESRYRNSDRYSDRSRNRDGNKCYNCGEEGHFARDCTYADRRNKCYGCGKLGHIRMNCPESGRKFDRDRRESSRYDDNYRRSRERYSDRRRSRSRSRDRSRSRGRDDRSNRDRNARWSHDRYDNSRSSSRSRSMRRSKSYENNDTECVTNASVMDAPESINTNGDVANTSERTDNALPSNDDSYPADQDRMSSQIDTGNLYDDISANAADENDKQNENF